MTTNGVTSLITPPSQLSFSALLKSENTVVRLTRTKDSYLAQENQGTLGSISHRGGKVACRGKVTCSERLTVEIHMWGSLRGGTMQTEGT